jgi:hypothetical protein
MPHRGDPGIGLAMVIAGFVYGVVAVSVPAQDPTPAQADAERFNLALSGWTMAIGGVVMFAGIVGMAVAAAGLWSGCLKGMPGYVEEELRGYFECGILCFSLRTCSLHGLGLGVCHRVLVQGKRRLPVMQRSAHGADLRPSRRSRPAAELPAIDIHSL